MNHTLHKIVENFSKLLSLEKLDIVVLPVETAYFNMNTRTLTLPEFSEKDPDILYFLVAHEVGHAIFSSSYNTPEKYRGSKKLSDLFQHTMNVLEDYRVDLLMCKRYKGLMNTFHKGEHKLHGRGFYKHIENNLKLDNKPKENFIPRLHLHLVQERLLANHYQINFTNFEKVLVDRCYKIRDGKDIEIVSDDILSYVLKKDSEKKQQEEENTEDDSEKNSSEEESQKNTPSGGSGESYSEDDSEDDSGVDSENDPDEDTENTQNEDSGETEKDFLDELCELYDDISEGECEENDSDINEAALEASLKMMDSLKHEIEKHETGKAHYVFNYPSVFYGKLKDIKPTKKLEIPIREKQIAYNLYKQFLMRRTAMMLKNIKTFNTGELDPNKLTQYKFTENIFLSKAVSPEDTNHLIVFFIDISSSMTNIFESVKNALRTFLFFCKLSGIKFQVWTIGRANLSSDFFEVRNKKSEFNVMEDYCPILLFDDRTSFVKIYDIVNKLKSSVSYTATDQAIFGSFPCVEKYILKNSIEKVRGIILTDGSPNTPMMPAHYTRSYVYSNELKKLFDMDAGYSVQDFAIKHFEKKFSANMIWFNIVSPREYENRKNNKEKMEIMVTEKDFYNNPQLFINKLSDYLV